MATRAHWFNYEFIGNRVHQLKLREFWDKPSGQILPVHFIGAKFLERSVELDTLTIKNKSILELGAGCGLVSLIAAHLGANVTATNEKAGFGVTETSINSCKYVCDPDTEEVSSLAIKSAELNWGTTVDAAKFPKGANDFIIGADLLGDASKREALLATLLQLCDANTTVLFTHLWCRRPIEEDFINNVLGEFFDVHETATDAEVTAYAESQLQANHPKASVQERRRSSSISIDSLAPNQPRTATDPKEYQEEGIVVLELHLKKQFTTSEGQIKVAAKVKELVAASSSVAFKPAFLN